MRIRDRHGSHHIEAIPATATVVLHLAGGRKLQVEQNALDSQIVLSVDFAHSREAIAVYDAHGGDLATLYPPVAEELP